jgi:hypothetical protein
MISTVISFSRRTCLGGYIANIHEVCVNLANETFILDSLNFIDCTYQRVEKEIVLIQMLCTFYVCR